MRRPSPATWQVLGSRMLRGRAGIALTLFVFDVLAVEGWRPPELDPT